LQVIVDEKHRLTLPKEVRKRLGIDPGSELQVELKGAEIVIRPILPVKNPTEALWGLVPTAPERNPKKTARQAIAKRKRLGG
jgi:AbrB family looped-hinge helix DNA binding protein